MDLSFLINTSSSDGCMEVGMLARCVECCCCSAKTKQKQACEREKIWAFTYVQVRLGIHAHHSDGVLCFLAGRSFYLIPDTRYSISSLYLVIDLWQNIWRGGSAGWQEWMLECILSLCIY